MRSLFVASLVFALAVASSGRAADDWEAKFKAADPAKGATGFGVRLLVELARHWK